MAFPHRAPRLHRPAPEALEIPDPLARSRPVLDVARMGAADREAMARGIPGLVLMEAAGQAVARAIRARWSRRPVVVLRGPGNNGGDGSVVARILARHGWRVRVLDLAPDAPLHGDAAVMARRWRGPTLPLTPEALGPEGLESQTLGPGELVVDALFGAGLSRPLAGLARAVVERISALGLDCVAVDIPSGIDGDTGQILGAAPRATLSVTFCHPKPGHLLMPGREYSGTLVVADIGIPPAVVAAQAPTTHVNAPGLWALPAPARSGHKYHRGHVTVMAGTRLTGAARLAGLGARRVGAGLVTLAGPGSALPALGVDQPGALLWDLDQDGPLETLLADRRRTTFILGPGRGRSPATAEAALTLAASGRAVVLDADALTSLAGFRPRLARALAGPCVLTPHDGEYAALFGDLDTGPDRLDRARKAARAVGAVVVLKGPDTVIAAPDGRAALTANAPPTLATAGSGDVLAGLVAGLMAQGLGPFEAASAAVWLHGAAAARHGPGLIAEDLPRLIPAVLADPGLGLATGSGG
ncbi:NAD(P)H-hydrate dehydratase [Pararhodospirillum oryzae]|uniref:Bifunctional NAD(P)H-hydrate repair enzyme n=1 Tax=Pararhodospirillum oryzae TaxID=478448 RepID=A0A512H8T3_9PROT|nr:NAD(P)H-hydrate dehydratase [Pararhodospirillum oryzae]GEO81864.1 bifunctional NAD(P)H-hydrate repair enzyme [Pararhodospirillum oryzae]